MREKAQIQGGYWCWESSEGRVEVRFAGKIAAPSPAKTIEGRGDLLAAIDPTAPRSVAWTRQIHSAVVVEVERSAIPGASSAEGCQVGEGDALTCREPGLALAISTADCVPIVLANHREIAVIHAGWRGIAASILPATIQGLSHREDPLTAWVGPAIGPCCYEVGEEVAQRVTGALNHNAPEVVRRDRGPRPFLDLRGAVHQQLEEAGIDSIHHVDVCTQCDPQRLWSYRRDEPGAGRNLTFAWRQSEG